jgi:Protein of unknown function (DUF3500)
MRHLRKIATRALLMICAAALLAAAHERLQSSSVMMNAAKAYLASLTPEQRERGTFAFASSDTSERTNWHFVPPEAFTTAIKERKGVALREMTSAQKHLAEALLSAGLSQQGIIKAHTIMSLDQVLKEMEKGGPMERDPEKYYVSIFGEPTDQGTWGYRFEGHHISLNFTIVKGRVASTPNFFGANPAEVREGPRAGLRALANEEDLGRKMVKSLTDAQRTIAIVDKVAYKDIITFDSRKAALNGAPNGLPFSKMTAPQREILAELVTDYASNFPEQIAAARLDQFHKTQANLFFAWSGGIERGDPHYYRIQTPAFLIEYDDTQNNANHIHTVWRDFNGDFGLDLLAQHYQSSPH